MERRSRPPERGALTDMNLPSPRKPPPRRRDPAKTKGDILFYALIAFLSLIIIVVLRIPTPKPAPEPAKAASTAVAAPWQPPREIPSGSGRRSRVVTAPAPATLEDRWGIEVSTIRLSMADSIVDVRYKVLDEQKAAQLATGKTPAYILQKDTGARLIMPTPPKEGAFPPTAHLLTVGKIYFAAVSNQKGYLKRGDKVDVVIGDSRATNLTLE